MGHPSSIPLIEFLKGRIYLGAYDRRPSNTSKLVFFTVEDELPYNAFDRDFGPLHMGHLYRFAVMLHSELNDESNSGKAIVIYSSTTPQARANITCMLCCYMVLIQSWAPHQVLQPISQIDPPVAPFRDAGYAKSDFEITIQDVVYGVWRAKERGMIDLTSFDLAEFEQYERVDQGDLSLVSPDFVAFASPKGNRGEPLDEAFVQVLKYFHKHDVKMVVRLNSHLYDAMEFTKRGIKHIDMIFDDGTCPTMDIVQDFVGVAEGIIAEGGKIAVHCKAGLGRTGCLIGAHLIYTHGFTANECIGYMRMIRPGMVVGPQQHWLYLHQNEFRNWKFTMVLDNIPNSRLSGFSPLIPYEVFKARQKTKYGNAANRSFSPMMKRRVSGRMKSVLHTAVPISSPGQPRKGTNGRYVSNSFITTNSDEEYEDIEESREEDEEADEVKQLEEDGDGSKNESVLNEISMDKENSTDIKHSDSVATPEASFVESRRNRLSQSPPSSWRVLRSITSPNSKKPEQIDSNSRLMTKVRGSKMVCQINGSSDKMLSSGAVHKNGSRKRS
ncbi:hypothetical protein DASC09_046820 [Saccharomycopsis crataegensis]|uniref:Tyrosine-protein phosphatase CDC14 n=1 Tax=Saccharomycopsis crataegensis TaxID=43959 RepID=A0AAV5QSH7_9ASCO|nr:hypothetical protein DASC09_046820 [Saccharomycopsis crataegensis]